MERWLTEMLVCPACVPKNKPLSLNIIEEDHDDVIEGDLFCHQCHRTYPIHNGVAVILPESSMATVHLTAGYNSAAMLSSYLWSHYSDLWNDPDATEAYETWASLSQGASHASISLDIGCAVGRLSFEMSRTHGRVVGIDTSVSFIQKARQLKKEKALSCDLIIEGLMTEKKTCDLKDGYNYGGTEFIVADALALPFVDQGFHTVSSINILEKVSSPVGHLSDVNRVLRERDSTFVFSDPFSWDESVSPSETWLSAGKNGNGNMRGSESMTLYFQGKDHVFTPPMEIMETGKVAWKIRKTENLWEHITSQFLVGSR